MISVSIHPHDNKASYQRSEGFVWVKCQTDGGDFVIHTGTPARAKAIAAAINGELDAQFADGAGVAKYDFGLMCVEAEDIKRIKAFLSGSVGREAIGESFSWDWTPEGLDFWCKERSSNAPLSDKARASLEAMVAQWDAEQAAKS